MKLETDLSSIPDTPCGRAFREQMENRAYGQEALDTAWAWFKSGWESKKPDRIPKMSKTTDRALESDRGMVAYHESTRDPIFLFQKLDYGCSEQDYDAMLALGWHCDEGWYTSDDIENADPVTPQMMADHDIGTKHWDTHHVFFSREEARQFGLRRAYHWGEEGVDWRVFCVCAEGELAEILLHYHRIKGNAQKALELLLDFYKAYQKPEWKEGESAEAAAIDVAVFLGQAVEDGWIEEFREM